MSDLNTQYKAFVAKLFARNGDLSKDFAHAVMGIVTECHELFKATDEVNALEEKGDLRFFVEAAELVIREHLQANPVGQAEIEASTRRTLSEAFKLPRSEAFQQYAVDLLDAAKPWVGYAKAPKDFAALLVKINVIMSIALTDSIGHHTEEQIMRANMAKLLKRYPGGEFDAFRAVERDLGAERAVLEQQQQQ